MTKELMIIYFCMALLDAMWSDAMERSCVAPINQFPMIRSLAVGVGWPISLPVQMWATTHESRWFVNGKSMCHV